MFWRSPPFNQEPFNPIINLLNSDHSFITEEPVKTTRTSRKRGAVKEGNTTCLPKSICSCMNQLKGIELDKN